MSASASPVDSGASPSEDAPPPAPSSALDRFFKISERGSTVSREVRGGLATFFAMAYIIVLNPIILGAGTDKFGHHLDNGQLVTATAFMAGLTTLLMGVIGNVPIALATGLGINAVVALQLAPKMSWPDAMGMVVLMRPGADDPGRLRPAAAGHGRHPERAAPVDRDRYRPVHLADRPGRLRLRHPQPGRGQDHRAPWPRPGGQLQGWPVVVFVLGLALMFILTVRRTKGAILIGIAAMAALAIVINLVADIPDAAWGLAVPSVPDSVVGTPDFGLIGQVSLFGGFHEVGWLTGCLFVFTVLLSGFFDAMGTIIGVGEESGLADERGQLPRMGRILFLDGVGVAGGGLGSCSANTCFVESTAACRRGRQNGPRQRPDRLALPAGAGLHPAGEGRPLPGGDPRTAGRRLPDHGHERPGDRLGRLHRRHPGVLDDRRDALHLQHHQRHRHGRHRLHPAARRHGPASARCRGC